MKDFIRISKYAGMREDLVQAGGGNSSFKISKDKMIIKASGYQLSEISENKGCATVNPEIIRNYFLKCDNIDKINNKESISILNKAIIEGGKPSIETFIHAISGKYTLHTHPIVVNAILCRKHGLEIIKNLFPKALIVPYATPGIELAKAYFKEYKKGETEGKNLNTVFLQNHGLICCGETADEVIENTEEITKKIEQFLNTKFDEYHNATKLWKYFPDKIVWKITDSNILNSFKKLGEWENAFCPDCIVFLGKRFLNLKKDFTYEDIEAFCTKFGAPVMINWAGTLYIVAQNVKKALEAQSVMSFSGQVMMVNNGIECNYLSSNEQDFLLNWSAEKYRHTIK